jgi:hypothetical protein
VEWEINGMGDDRGNGVDAAGSVVCGEVQEDAGCMIGDVSFNPFVLSLWKDERVKARC